MMLQALIAYADREGLGDADFETVGVRWLIPITRKGVLAGNVVPLLRDGDGVKPAPKQMTRPFTSPNELNQGTKSHFLCDNLERATLLLDPKAPEKASGRRVQHDYFRSLLDEAAKACQTQASDLRAILAFLDDKKQMSKLHEQFGSLKAKPSNNAVFSVDGEVLLEQPALKQFWRQRRRKQAAAGPKRTKRICIATGDFGEVLDTTEKIKGVPGGLATGTNLISFDKDAFCSYGLEQAQNAAVSPIAELKIRSALATLISKGLRIQDAVFIHWTREAVAQDPLDLLASAQEEEVAELIKSIKAGHRSPELDCNLYYAMSLSGNGARIMVRSWLTSTLVEVQHKVADWFTHLSIVSPDGMGVKRDFKLGALLYSLVRADLSELAPQITSELFYSALTGSPLPQSVLAAALRRQQLDQEKKADPARMALIKACLIRSSKKQTPKTNEECMSESLNLKSVDSAYLCGQLFAVFDRLQYLAQGGVNAGVIERYYASASTTPALVMGRLFRNAQFHLAKMDEGTAVNASKDFERITKALGKEFPKTLDPEGQGRFALGYYHQKAEYRRISAERKEAAMKAELSKSTQP